MKRKPPKPLTPAQILRKERAAMNRNKHTAAALQAAKAAGMPEPQLEFKFDLIRKWRFDFGWPDCKIAIEINGGGKRGRHASIKGMASDCEKTNRAVIQGWRVLTYTVIQMKDPMQICADLIALRLSDAKARVNHENKN